MGEFSKRLKQVRTERELTFDECAALLDTTKSAIWRYENDENVPSIDFVMKVSKVFRVSADWLAGLSNSREIGQILERELLDLFNSTSEDGRKRIIDFAKFTLQSERENLE